MAQPPQPAKPVPPKEPPMNVPVPGAPPKPHVDEKPAAEVPDTIKAEQEAGKHAIELAEERLKAEQDAGKEAVAQNEKLAGIARRPVGALPSPTPRSNPLHGNSKE